MHSVPFQLLFVVTVTFMITAMQYNCHPLRHYCYTWENAQHCCSIFAQEPALIYVVGAVKGFIQIPELEVLWIWQFINSADRLIVSGELNYAKLPTAFLSVSWKQFDRILKIDLTFIYIFETVVCVYQKGTTGISTSFLERMCENFSWVGVLMKWYLFLQFFELISGEQPNLCEMPWGISYAPCQLIVAWWCPLWRQTQLGLHWFM